MRKITALLLTALLLAAVGCRSHRHLSKGPVNDSTSVSSATQEPKPHPIRLDTIQNVSYTHYSANFSCTVEGITVNGQLRITHDSVVWISLNKIVELGRLMLTPTRVQAYSKMMNKHFDGSYDDLRQRWGVDIDFATLEALLTGNCPPRCSKAKEPQRNGDTVTLWYSQKSGTSAPQRQMTLKKDFQTKRLTAVKSESPSVGQKLNVEYRRQTDTGGQMLPSTIGFSLKSRQFNTSTEIELDRITLNRPQSYPFNIPKKSKKI